MDASGLKRFKELEAHTAQTDVCRAGTGQRGDEGPGRKNTVGPAQKREAVRYLAEVHARQLRRSCDCVGLSRSAWHAPPLDWTVRAMPRSSARWPGWSRPSPAAASASVA